MNPLFATMSAKLILGLGLALVLSLAGNFLLVRGQWIAAGEAKSAKERADLVAKVQGFEKTAAINAALKEQSAEDHTALLDELEGIAKSAKANRSRSQKVSRANPLPANCVPTEPRMDAVNKTLGPQG